MDKLRMHSPDLTAEKIRRIAELLPNCVTESRGEDGAVRQAIDFDQLRQELSDHIVEGPAERYRLDWPGKREAILTANAPIAKTLRPSRDESVDFDTTKNLFIEGDNLDALKLLQETYLGKVKLIYIDPPYNTGKDFIYEDNFAEDSVTYLLRSNQQDDAGGRLVSNTDANGRFHSDWLSMLYPRLKLAKNLLKSNGVIFISIDNNEVHNLRTICSDVFGADNFVGTIVWKNVTDNNPTTVATEHEYIHVFARNKAELEGEWKSKISVIKDALIRVGNDLNAQYSEADQLQEAYSRWFRDNKAFLGPLDRYKYIDKGGVYTGSQSVHNPGKEGYRYDVVHPITGKACREPLLGYRFKKPTMDALLEAKRILFGEDESKIIELKVYASEFEDKLESVIELDGRSGPYDLKTLFPEIKKAFTNPKPVDLIERFASFTTKSDDVIVDFFGGSGTTAQAVMRLNAQDGGTRRFVLVQAPETPDSDIGIEGLKTIADICKERIRRAGLHERKSLGQEFQKRNALGTQMIKGEAIQSSLGDFDAGFRILKIDTSNLQDVYYTPDETQQSALLRRRRGRARRCRPRPA